MSSNTPRLNAAHTCAHQARSRARGQVIVLFALMITVLLLVLGGALDMASVVVERARLQNAADSAALAAAQTYGDTADYNAATNAAANYLTANGYRPQVQPDCTSRPNQQISITICFPPLNMSDPEGAPQLVDVSITESWETAFWRLFGMRFVTLNGFSEASSPTRRFDIFLSIDETSSMSGTDMQQLIQAADSFVTTLNPTPGDPYSPKIGMGVFEGVRYGAYYTDSHGYNEHALRESTILTNLTNDVTRLHTLITGNGCGSYSLPGGAMDQPPLPFVSYPPTSEQALYPDLWGPFPLTRAPAYPHQPPQLSDFACPLHSDSWGYNQTFIGDGVTVAFNRGEYYDKLWDAFDAQHGGRDSSVNGAPPARRILVLMTDGTSNVVPLTRGGPGDCPSSLPGCISGILRQEINQAGPDSATAQVEDDAAITAANIAKSGPDGDPSHQIEIYTIGFFGENESALSSGDCPAPVVTPDVQAKINSSRDDKLLWTMSSSSRGSCDHYFPVPKQGSGQSTLASVFQSIANRIKRAELAK